MMPTTDTTEKITINGQLVIEALARIEAFPERWNQGNWASLADLGDEEYMKIVSAPEPPPVCKTAFCVAGWIVNIADPKGHPQFAQSDMGKWMTTSIWVDSEGNKRDYETFATELLGIPAEQVGRYPASDEVLMIGNLFGGSNSRDDIFDYAAELLGMDVDGLRATVAERATVVEAEWAKRKEAKK